MAPTNQQGAANFLFHLRNESGELRTIHSVLHRGLCNGAFIQDGKDEVPVVEIAAKGTGQIGHEEFPYQCQQNT